MQNLIFEELILLSKVEKKARRIRFSPKINILIGENDVGKSTVIKSLYHALGADTPQINNSRWKKANPIYCLKFSLDNQSYTLIRDESYFGFFNSNKQLIGKYKGISKNSGIADAINPLLKFDIELEGQDEKLHRLGPAYYYLPFYIDQDDGWNKTWVSFTGLPAAKSYRGKLLDYHLGIRPQSYYDAKRKVFELENTNKELNEQKNSLIKVRDSFQKRKVIQNVDIDPAAFKKEIEELITEYNKISEEQQNHLNLIKKVRNEKLAIENEIEILYKSISELNADYEYCESPKTPDHLGCPVCGTDFENSISERFGILDDMDYSKSLIDQRKKEALLVEDKLKTLDLQYNKISKKLSSVQEILNRKKKDVTFSEVISAEGYKEVIKSIGVDITTIDTRQVELHQQIIELNENTKIDSDLKKKIFDFYKAKMKESLHSVNVQVLNEEDYDSPSKIIKTNALGSDLPRSLLAQYISLMQTMYKFNSFVICPLVIDSPLQQEQDIPNAGAIFNFIFSNTLPSQQLILGTVRLDGLVDTKDIPNASKKIIFEEKFGLLSATEYEDVLREIEPLHNLTLKVD